MREWMKWGWPLWCMVGLLCHSPSFAQSQSSADATVRLVYAAEVSAQQANQLLFNPIPGVFTISIPDPTGYSTIDLAATGVDPATGALTFAASGDNAWSLRRLMKRLGSGSLKGSFSTGLTVSGFINGRGVQIVIRETHEDSDGGGSLRATITFD